MGKKSINIKIAKLDPKLFLDYLVGKLGDDVMGFLESLSADTEVLIFSGIIRDYFMMSSKPIRDLDLVIKRSNDKVFDLINSIPHTKNSFGGYKINLYGLNIDLWELENTWGLKNDKINPLLFNEISLLDTAFFNFSSVIYNYNRKEFIYNNDFIDFLKTRKMDLVLEQNPLPQLCLINTLYYKDKYHFGISNNLKNYFVKNFGSFNQFDYDEIQKKHFGEIKYSYPYLKEYEKIFTKQLEKFKD